MWLMAFKNKWAALFAFSVLLQPTQGWANNLERESDGYLIQESDLAYRGAFRVPQGSYNGMSFGYGGYALTFNPQNNSLFIVSIYGTHTAEITIPAPVISSDLADLYEATNLQQWQDITEGNRTNIGAGGSVCNPSGVYIGGFLVWREDLIGSVYGYYDAGYCAELSHFISGQTLSIVGDFAGMYRVGDSSYNVGTRAGYMTKIPSSWQSSFGGAPAVTGRAFGPIITRSSFGPSLWTFDPDEFGVTEPVPSTPLVYYPDSGEDATLGAFGTGGDANPFISPRDLIGGVVFPEGSDSVLFVGTHGSGEWCYKCPEPNNPAGNGSYPYHYFVWAYSAADLAAAYSGNYLVTQADYDNNRFWDGSYPDNFTLGVGQTVKPWHVIPYGTWVLETPITPTTTYSMDVGGATYDPTTMRIYFSAMSGDGDRPLIHVFQIEQNGPGIPSIYWNGE